MATSSKTQRAIAEINFGEGAGTPYKIGSRPVHQFWHLYSSHCRHLFLAPQRRPDTGRTAWTWREAMEKRPVTAVELAEVRRRLTEASRSLNGGSAGLDDDDDEPAGGANLEGQVRAKVSEMIAQLITQRDAALSAFVCRTEAGLMLHSWGATVAAEPHYPDTQNGEISGLLMVGEDRPIGVPVALETPQGGNVARTKSDSNGHFRFSNVAPGNYRVRVLERSDFPANGVSVTMEHESITGLELRSTTGESSAPVVGPAISLIDHTPPWYKRRWTTMVALLLLLGIGSCVWRSSRSTNSPTAAQSHSEEWQSAKDQVAAGDAKNSTDEKRKVGTEPAWSSLSKSIQVPKLSKSPAGRSPVGPGSAVENHSSSHVDESPSTGSPSTDAKTQPNDLPGKAESKSGAAAHPKAKESNRSPSDQPGEGKLPDERAATAPADPDAAKPADAKLAKSSPAAVAKKRPTVAATADAPGDEAPAESTTSPGGEGAEKTPGASPAATTGAKTSKPAKTPSPAGKNANPQEESAEGGAGEGGANAPADSAASPPSANQSKSAPGKKAKSVATGSNASETGAESSTPVGAAESTPDESPDEARGAKNSSPSAAPKKRPTAGPTPAPAESTHAPKPEVEATPATSPDATVPPKKTVKRPPVNAGKSSRSAPPASAASAATAADSDSAPEDDSPSSAATQAATPAKRKSSSKPAAEAEPASSGSENESPSETAVPAATGSSTGTPLVRVVAEAPLVKFGQVRASAWKPRLLRDQIVPTHPMTAAEEEAVEAMREKLLQERRAQIPAAFLEPKARHGVILELPASADAAESGLRWRDETGAELSGATIVGARAELTWVDHDVPRAREYVLNTSDGHERARVTVASSGAIVLKAELTAKGRYWVEVDSSSTSAANTEQPRFDWRLLSGESIPTSWTRDDRWQDAHIHHRLEIPLDVTAKRVGHYGLALLDLPTGWALVCDVAVQ